VLMGLAMAGMLLPGLKIFWTGGWQVVFALGAVGFAWPAVQELRTSKAACDRPRHHHVQHVLACGAMLYMLADARPGAAASGSGMDGMVSRAAPFPTLALVLAIGLLGYVIWTADRLTSLAPVAALAARASVLRRIPASNGVMSDQADPVQLPGTAGPAGVWQIGPVPLSPRLAACCEIVMGVTMGYMLIMML